MFTSPLVPLLPRSQRLMLAMVACCCFGCSADDRAGLRPVFFDRFIPAEDDPTTSAIERPAQRIAELRELGKNAKSQTAAEQQQISALLARQIQREQDPLVRQATIHALKNFSAPLAGAVIRAGLKDPDRDVRAACCHALAARGGQDAAMQLTQVVERDNSVDVRIAAIRALGELQSAAALPNLVPALESRDPAIQFAAIDAARAIRTSQGASDLGSDVNAWLAYARGQQQPIPTQPEAAAPLEWAKRIIPGWN